MKNILRQVITLAVLATVFFGCGRSSSQPASSDKQPAASADPHFTESIKPYLQPLHLATLAASKGNYGMALGIMDYLTNQAPDIVEFKKLQAVYQKAYLQNINEGIKRNSKLSRPRISVEQLKGGDHERAVSLTKRMEQIGQLPVEQRSAAAQDLLADVQRLTLDQPNLTRGWLMQAGLCLPLGDSLHGKIAARNLVELRAWESTQPKVLDLLVRLVYAGWLYNPGLDAKTAPAFQALAAEQAGLESQDADVAAYSDLMNRVKKFNLDHPQQRCGWLLQLRLAGRLDRTIDQTVALNHLSPSH